MNAEPPYGSLESWRQREQLLERFEQAWVRGETPKLADFLPKERAERHGHLVELVRVDMEFRQKAGLPAQIERYLETFPEYREDLLALADGNSTCKSKYTAEKESHRAGAILPTIPGYEVLEELGRGGMGVVYRAHQSGLNRMVALKMILGGGHARPEDLVRFRTEAEAVARLQHPHIVQIHAIGEQDGLPFFSLEFCGCGSLAAKLQGNPQPALEAARTVEALARAMHAAHQAGIVHRDLKPANVLLTADGTLKVTDFGLAKQLDADSAQTRSGVIVGTPSYMAPEQAEGKTREVGRLADVYALGAILYEMLTGRPPFKAASPFDTIRQVTADKPVQPRQLNTQVPRDLETICLKCLRKEPQRRYGSSQELSEDLGRWLRGEPIRAKPVQPLERLWKWVRRKPAAAILVTIGLLLPPGAFLVVNEAQSVAKTDALVDSLARAETVEVPLDNQTNRMMRGGSFENPLGYLRSANRGKDLPTKGNYDLGFRVARTLR